MKESIGGAQVLLISITILLIMVILLSSSISYTKAFKARNGVINTVQKYATYDMSAEDVLVLAENEIDEFLDKLGYMLNVGPSNRSCESSSHYQDYFNNVSGTEVISVAKDQSFNYCIFQYEDENKNRYYGVETYMYFELPIFGRSGSFAFPIYGNTKTFFYHGTSPEL